MRSPGKTRFRSSTWPSTLRRRGRLPSCRTGNSLFNSRVKRSSGSRSRSHRQPIRGRSGAQLASRQAELARNYFDLGKYEAADRAVDEALGYIDRDTGGEPRSALDQRPLAEALYVRGRLWNEYGKLERAYATLLDSIRLTRHSEHPDAAMTGDCAYFLGIVCGRLGRDMEAAYWLWSAVESEHRDASLKLGERFLDHPREVAAVVPKPVLQLLVGLGGAKPNERETFSQGFANKVAELRTAEAKRKRLERAVEVGELADQYHQSAQGHRALGRVQQYRQAIQKEFDLRGQLVQLDPKDTKAADSQAAIAAEISQSYHEGKEGSLALQWTTRAATLGHFESSLLLADWYERGTNAKADRKEADRFRHDAYHRRGMRFFIESRFEDALRDFKNASALTAAGTLDLDMISKSYAALGQWDAAIADYQRAFDSQPDSAAGSRALLKLLAAWIVTNRTAHVEELAVRLANKGWQLRADNDDQRAQYDILYTGFRAIARRVLGQEAAELEESMAKALTKTRLTELDWIVDDLARGIWIAKVAPQRQEAVKKVVGQLATKGQPVQALKRTIALIYGVFADGKPFWAFVAVKTSLYKVFLEDQKHGKIDLGNFEYYGEVIIGNEGKYPPDDIINRVANVYQIDRDRFMKNVREDVVEAVPKVQAFLAESDAESRRKKRAELAVGPWDKLVASAPADLPGLLHERALDFEKKRDVKEVARCAAKMRRDRRQEPSDALQRGV